MKEQSNIRWEYKGKSDFINGTGAYLEEKLIGYLGSLIIPFVLIFRIINGELDWNYLQIIVSLFIAFDLGGGMISNSLNSCKRFYHSEISNSPKEKILKNKILFASWHIQPFIVGLLFSSLDLTYGVFWYSFFMISVLLVYKTPLYLKRPVAMLIILIAILINGSFINPILGFEWFIPVLFLKIIYGHMVKEEPYRKAVSTI